MEPLTLSAALIAVITALSTTFATLKRLAGWSSQNQKTQEVSLKGTRKFLRGTSKITIEFDGGKLEVNDLSEEETEKLIEELSDVRQHRQ